MKLQHFAVIFIIIIVPISFLLSTYIHSNVDIVSKQTSYDAKLSDATYDAVKAFEINTEDIVLNKEQEKEQVQAAVATFYNTLSSNLGYSNSAKEELQAYTPAVLVTMYDGYYVYSKYNIKEDGNSKYEYCLSPINYYSCRYKKGTDYDFVVNYSLDNFISIYGKVNGEMVRKSGYLINYYQIDAKTRTKINSGVSLDSISIDDFKIEPEELKEYIVTMDNNQIVNKEYNYVVYDGVKIYTYKDGNGNNIYFKNNKGKKEIITDATLIEYLNYTGMQSKDALNYYTDSYIFSWWVNDNLNTITQADAINPETGEKWDLNKYQNLSDKPIFKISSVNENNPEKKDSIFEQHRQCIIKNSIERYLKNKISNFDKNSPTTYPFALPNIKETDWEKIINNISITAFLQGTPVLGRYYNNYSVAISNKNKQYIKGDSIMFLTSDGNYHKMGCKTLLEETKNNPNFLTNAVYNTEIKRRELELSRQDKVFYYKYRKDADTAYANCYDCIVNATSGYNIQDIINGQITDENGVIYTKQNLNKVRQKYFTTLAREKYQINNIQGKIKIVATASKYNAITGHNQGAKISGVKYGIYDDNGILIESVVTDNNGIAITTLLVKGKKYTIKEIDTAFGYKKNTTSQTIYLPNDGETAECSFENEPLKVEVTLAISRTPASEVNPEEEVIHEFSISNSGETNLNLFSWINSLNDVNTARITKISTGTYNVSKDYYIKYKTNNGNTGTIGKYNTTNNNYIDLSNLPLGEGEYVTSVWAEFGSVSSGFCSRTNIQIVTKGNVDTEKDNAVTTGITVSGTYLGAYTAKAYDTTRFTVKQKVVEENEEEEKIIEDFF